MIPGSRPGTDLVEFDERPVVDAIGFVHNLLGSIRLSQMYPPDHPIVESKRRELENLLQHGLSAQEEFTIEITGGTVHLDGRPLHHEPIPAARELADFGISSFRFFQGLEPAEVRIMIDVLQTRAFNDGELADGSIDPQLRNVELARLVPLDTTWRGHEWASEPAGQLDPDYAESLRLAQATFDDAAVRGRVDTAAVRDLVDLMVFKVASSSVAISQILAIKQYENLTYCHSVNVAMLSLLLGRQVGLDKSLITVLVEAALLHDVGKTQIPLEVVQKPGALDKREREQIEMHPLLGAEILSGTAGLHPLTPVIALEHHRTVRGGGYPDLGEAVIPHVLSQLVSVADVYEAVTGARTYRPPMRPEQACLLLARLSGESLNTSLVKSFINAVTFFPIGSYIYTSKQEFGIVVATNPGDVLHPNIAVVSAGLDRIVGVLDTRQRDESGAYLRHVVETLDPTTCPIDIAAALEEANTWSPDPSETARMPWEARTL